ncbi:MAG: hypothetical protein AAFO61_09225, partial [Pseudomonadota bacterium]
CLRCGAFCGAVSINSSLIAVAQDSVMERQIRQLVILAACAALVGCAGRTVTGSVSENAYGAPALLSVCSGFGCIYKEKVAFSKREQARLQRIMGQPKTAAQERKRIGRAVATMERMSRRKLRFHRDSAFAYQKHRGLRGQMDCVDESLNTTAYMAFLQSRGLLKHHKVIARYAERGFLLDGRYPHKSARIRENGGADWAVDSWYKADGKPPVIVPLKAWYKQRNRASDYTTG